MRGARTLNVSVINDRSITLFSERAVSLDLDPSRDVRKIHSIFISPHPFRGENSASSLMICTSYSSIARINEGIQ